MIRTLLPRAGPAEGDVFVFSLRNPTSSAQEPRRDYEEWERGVTRVRPVRYSSLATRRLVVRAGGAFLSAARRS